ncbi:MAG TPA: DEAD/DEAH box helicase family protein [Polyangiaceae bacterium]|nr:DEAD/DEAH box helicase family protein [Polyangiaceae bacterium]
MVTIASNELAFAIGAPEPVVPGHALVVLRRSPSTYFEASAEEKAALWALVDVVQAQLEAELQPEGYEVRFATGAELHGAARALVHIIPQRARAPALATGGEQDPFARHLWPLFSGASEIAIVAAFVTETGLAAIERTVFGALRAGARLRIVTGDYLAFNQVEALQQLLGWSQLAAPGPSATGSERRLAVRVVETAQADGSEQAFHPKAWLFESASFGVAFVGSSNLSRSALETGIEWNLRVERAIDPVGYASVRAAVDALWSGAIELSADWIAAYAERVRQAPRSLPSGDGDVESLEPPPEPHVFQQEALAALQGAREQGRRRALVVLATGLGKTWLAGFDVARFAEGARRWPRVLFLAHREELLAQAARVFRRLLSAAGQRADIGWCAGDLLQPGAAVVVGSIQKLCRAENLERLAQQRFDYVIVDEVHHADAPTHRRVLERLDPTFLLGLTATPERADDGDILAAVVNHLPDGNSGRQQV